MIIRCILVTLALGVAGCATLPSLSSHPASRTAHVLAASETPRPGTYFTDCAHDCPVMTVVPAGSQLLGSTAAESARENITEEKSIARDKPQYTVTIANPFAIGKFEVTIGQYRAFATETGRPAAPDCWAYNPAATVPYAFENMTGISWHDYAVLDHQVRDDEPVACVDFNDATAYVAWLSVKTGKTYRLPSEGEWEYAARAGTSTARFWGDDRDHACDYANVGDLTAAARFGWRDDPQYHFMCTDGYPMAAPVGSFKPNPFGLYDTQGNVYEWARDCFVETNAGAPTDGSARQTADCPQHTLRGGGFGIYPQYGRTSFRLGTKPEYRSFLVGFRVMRDLS